jgi:gas vesicle protein
MASPNMHTTTIDFDSRLTIGVLMGACAGAALTMWLAPRATEEIRQRFADFTRTVSDQASTQYQQARSRVGEAVDDLSSTADGVRNSVADTLERGAAAVDEVTGAKT